MKSYGTGPRFRSEMHTQWPEQCEPEQGESASQGLGPLHLCEVPPEMYPTRERLAVKWAGRTPIIPLPAETKKTKKAPAKRARKTA